MSAFFYFCDTYSTLYKTLQFPAHRTLSIYTPTTAVKKEAKNKSKLDAN